jgi:hypothetical protein
MPKQRIDHPRWSASGVPTAGRRHSAIGYLSPIAYETQMIKKAETT